MSDAAQLARAAREHLAAALKALQSDNNVPEALLDVAEPIAEAMSVLHRIERSEGANLDGREGILVNVRAALDKTQKVTEDHPATELVMEAVAASLSKVHALTRVPLPQAAAPAPAAPAAAPQRPSPQPIPAPATAPHVPVAAAPQPVMTQAVAQPRPSDPYGGQGMGGLGPKGTLIPNMTMPSNPTAQGQRPPPAPPPSAPQQQAYAQPAPQQAYAAPQPYQAPQPAPAPAPPPQQIAVEAQPPGPVPQDAPTRRTPAPPPRDAVTTAPATPNANRIDVELGIHSASNFYKGLGGNDVIEHGGIFVATYKVPKMGASVNLRVLLPGDYEFNAIGVVQWTRAGGEGSEPGFGARFTQITPEGRQLVYRYARNREPMFYDDL